MIFTPMKKSVLIIPVALSLLAITSRGHADERTDAYYDAIYDAIMTGDTATADSIIGEWKLSGLEPVEAMFAEGYVALRKGETKRGEALLDSAEVIMPRRLDFRTRHIREQYIAGKKQDAFAGLRELASDIADTTEEWTIYDQTADISAQEEAVVLLTSHMYYQMNEVLPFEEIVEFADSVAAVFPIPGKMDTKILLGQIMYEKEDFNGAVATWESILPMATEPRLSQLRLMLMFGYTNIDEPDKWQATAMALMESPDADLDVIKTFNEAFLGEPDTLSYRQFQYTVLSMFAAQPFRDNFPEALCDPQHLLKDYLCHTNLTVSRDVTGITAESFDIANSDSGTTVTQPVIVWTMPEPQNMIDTKYVAFVPDGDNHFRYITLEKTLPSETGETEYIVCEAVFREDKTSYDHLNYGMGFDDSLTTADFARIAARVVAESRQPAAAFNP